MEATGLKEGILFIDEINCVSETLAPTMLQFLQCKTFGNQAVPAGWVIVAAGNPPEYNKSVRDFDIVTLDRVRRMDIEPDLPVWKDYARAAHIHSAILSYLELHPQNFYQINADVDGTQFVTARGWEDLSNLLNTYESLGLQADEELIRQYIQHQKIAEDFSAYLDLYYKYRDDYGVEDILAGQAKPAAFARLLQAPFDEKLSLVSLILSGLETRFSASRRADAAADSCYAFLRETKKAFAEMPAELAQEPNCWAQLFDQMTADYEAETQKKRTAGLLVIAGGLGPVIPPSIIMVLYCTLTGASVTNMFSQGMVIGILIMIVLILEALYYAHKEKWPKAETKHTAGEIGKIFLEAVPALLTPVIILGGIYSGLLTATESAAVACVWAFIAGVFIYKEIKIADLIPILMKSAKSAAMILFIIAASTAFSWVFTFSGASAALVQLVVSMNLNKTLFCLVVAIILLIFGTFMEGTAIAVLLVPVLWPIAESMGVNVIHFGMILCISNVIGTMTPPVAVNIFSAVQVTRSVRELKIGEISKAEIPFFIGYVAVFFLCVFSETFCTFLIR
jgi:tripartite ATP-independent transporter DctM subunit